MKLNSLGDFRLVGGTALALQLGHRNSIDIDLFTDKPFDTYSIFEDIKKEFKNPNELLVSKITPGSVVVLLNMVKIDIYQWKDKFIRPPVTIDNIRMAHVEDVIAMKLKTVSDKIEGRTKKKDFYDLATLLEKHDVKKMLALYQEKYGSAKISEAIQGLKNHVNVLSDEIEPKMHNAMSWQQATAIIDKNVQEYLISHKAPVKFTMEGSLGSDPVKKDFTTKSGEQKDVVLFNVLTLKAEKMVWQTCQVFDKDIQKTNADQLHKGDCIKMTGFLGKEFQTKTGETLRPFLVQKIEVIKLAQRQSKGPKL